MISRPLPALALACLLLLQPVGVFPAAARDEVSTGQDGRILHRRLPPAAGSKDGSPVFVYDPRRGGTLPREFQRDGLVLPMPAESAPGKAREAMYSASGVDEGLEGAESEGAGSDGPEGPGTAEGVEGGPESAGAEPGRSDGGAGERMDPRGTLGSRALPDRDTEMEGTLGYHAVFDPSVLPFKRNRVLDTVAPDGTLALDAPRLQPVRPIGNHVAPGHEVFWGSVLVIGEAGQDIPLPSVAPTSRILSWETTPKTTVTFLKDQADNFYVRPTRAGRFRLVFLMDAPSSYFGRDLPRGLSARDVPSSMRPRPPSEFGRKAVAVARALGISPAAPYDALVGDLVRHFRSFEAGEPPPESDDIYTDLALGKRGICRHRTYAFVVTARGLGIPARYVFNEAHVFAEIWVPGREAGWLRVDLGGGAERLVVRGAEDKLRHRPRGRDPFDRPEPYASQLAEGATAGATDVEGLPPTVREDRMAEGGAGTRAHGARAGSVMLPPPVTRRILRDGVRSTRTSLTLEAALVFRGEPVHASGMVTDRGGRAVPRGTVQLILFDASTQRAIGLLGMATVGPDGRYATAVTVPESQSPGGYEVVAEYLGAGRYGTSRSP